MAPAPPPKLSARSRIPCAAGTWSRHSTTTEATGALKADRQVAGSRAHCSHGGQRVRPAARRLSHARRGSCGCADDPPRADQHGAGERPAGRSALPQPWCRGRRRIRTRGRARRAYGTLRTRQCLYLLRGRHVQRRPRRPERTGARFRRLRPGAGKAPRNPADRRTALGLPQSSVAPTADVTTL